MLSTILSTFIVAVYLHCSHKNVCTHHFQVIIIHFDKFSGGTWEGEPELNHRENNGMQCDEVDIGYFERLGARTEICLEKFFTVWGTWCAKVAKLLHNSCLMTCTSKI